MDLRRADAGLGHTDSLTVDDRRSRRTHTVDWWIHCQILPLLPRAVLSGGDRLDVSSLFKRLLGVGR